MVFYSLTQREKLDFKADTSLVAVSIFFAFLLIRKSAVLFTASNLKKKHLLRNLLVWMIYQKLLGQLKSSNRQRVSVAKGQLNWKRRYYQRKFCKGFVLASKKRLNQRKKGTLFC